MHREAAPCAHVDVVQRLERTIAQAELHQVARGRLLLVQHEARRVGPPKGRHGAGGAARAAVDARARAVARDEVLQRGELVRARHVLRRRPGTPASLVLLRQVHAARVLLEARPIDGQPPHRPIGAPVARGVEVAKGLTDELHEPAQECDPLGGLPGGVRVQDGRLARVSYLERGCIAQCAPAVAHLRPRIARRRIGRPDARRADALHLLQVNTALDLHRRAAVGVEAELLRQQDAEDLLGLAPVVAQPHQRTVLLGALQQLRVQKVSDRRAVARRQLANFVERQRAGLAQARRVGARGDERVDCLDGADARRVVQRALAVPAVGMAGRRDEVDVRAREQELIDHVRVPLETRARERAHRTVGRVGVGQLVE